MTSRPLATADGSVSAGKSIFISVAELRECLLRSEAARPLLLDARVERQYLEGHLPGAYNMPARELNPVENGVRRLVRRAELRRSANWLADADWEADWDADRYEGRDIVLYGARGGADAAHLWWTLRSYGLRSARLLDGGVEAWLADGEALVGGPERSPSEGASGGIEAEAKSSGLARPEVAPAGYLGSGEPDRDRLVSAEELLSRLDDADVAIVDTREPEEYRGELIAARRGGHVPGALLFPWTLALTPELRLRPETELRDLLAPVLEKPEVIVYCQSGVRAAHTAAVLEMLGHPGTRLYLGSWGEWGNREDTPVELEAES